MWLDECGEVMYLHSVTTTSPQDALFNILCGMLVTAATFFQSKERSENQIRKLVKQIRDYPAHYCAELNGQVISLIEKTNKQNNGKYL